MTKKLKLVLFISLSTACFAVSAAPSGNAAAGKAKAEPCKACHGADGNGSSSATQFPRLAGQNADYLYNALVQYQTGKRKNPLMSAQVAALKPVDLADLSAYYASQKGLEVKY